MLEQKVIFTMKNKNLEIYLLVKKWRDQVLDKPARGLIEMGVSANQVSVFRAVLAVPLFFSVGLMPWLAVILLISNYLIDGLDGVMARISKKSNTKGRALDVCIDNFYVIPLVLGLAYFQIASGFWTAFYIFNASADYFINYLRFGIDVGKYPFSFSKYFVYFALLIYAIGFGNYFDVVLVFWSVALVIINVFALKELYDRA